MNDEEKRSFFNNRSNRKSSDITPLFNNALNNSHHSPFKESVHKNVTLPEGVFLLAGDT